MRLTEGRRTYRRRAAALTLGFALAGAAALGGVAVTTAAAASAAQAAGSVAASAATVTVNGTAGLGTFPSEGVGLNTAVYDTYMNDTPIPGLLKAAGIGALRYPGGSYSDIYNWQTQTAVAGGYVAPNTSFSQFAATAHAANAQSIVTVNYGTGTTSLTSAWVQAAASSDANVKYWEIGNEIYGNGTYGANWETDSHCRTTLNGSAVTVGNEPSQTYNCGPTEYAQNLLGYISAIKAVSSSAHVCAVLTTPGFWPDNVTNAEYPQSWNQTVLTALKSRTDCVIVHYYPSQSTDSAASMLSRPSDIPGIVSALRSEIQQYAGVNPAGVPILVSETNSQVDSDTQPGALFAADMYMSWLENGVSNVDWWDEHNGPTTPSTVGGAQDYGDYGMFANGANSSGATEPAVDTPFSPYYAVEMLSRLGGAGDTMVTSSSSSSLLKTHAVRHGGNLDILIDNEDPSNPYTVNLAYNNFTPTGGPTVYTLANNANKITSTTQASTSAVTVAPYSLTVLQVPGSGGTGTTAPGAPGQPTVSNLSSTTSGPNTGTGTLNWPAATAGTYPVAGYQLYQLGSGGSSTLVGSPTGTTWPLSGLTIGASYTYDVVAVDTHGNPSLPSAPLTFTVPPPSDSSCAVHYATTSSWSGGFGASITLTNRAGTPVDGWKLTFTFPAAGEAVQSGWNGTWTQSGQAVTVTNADWNGTIPAGGGSVSLGFNGVDTGLAPAPAPTSFSINGTICANN
ncbi:cellulose binding domain-containing protein [Streptomyces sp. Li-HN-5-11]|uniref:cellulose binding domain-containing protein n=1 Tax=Streptomyces sp. Li-HN-5-11 TaxID=3075432 RepID=UPI0028B0370F|nr:cellulose binding domain-containing protein [Streptomyces sp. Li-HN-5-11]WNM33702.1 cellulose binding domain-containing protein [Streptomyces sp. Li-HN-5-11]